MSTPAPGPAASAHAEHRWTFLLMVPGDLSLLVWLWMGRLLFGVGGWFLLILLPVVLVGVVVLALCWVLALVQRPAAAGRPRSLTGHQHAAQLATWVGLLGAGAFLPDFGDTEDSYTSLLGRLFGTGDAVMLLSWLLTGGFALVAAVGVVLRVVSLTGGRRRAAPPTAHAA